MYGNYLVRRTLEIALSGNHSIVIIGNPDNLTDEFKEAFKKYFKDDKVSAILSPCRCGFLTDDKIPCLCSVLDIKRYRKLKKWQKSVGKADIVVELARPREKEYDDKCKFDDISTWGIFPMPEDVELDDMGIRLLNYAIEKLGFTVQDRESVLRMAWTIAQMDQSNIIKAQYISEAVQYRSCCREYK